MASLPPPSPPSLPTNRRTGLVTALVATALLGGGVAVYAATRDTTAPPVEASLTVTDDTGLFNVVAPDSYEIDTAPVDLQGVSTPSITAAGNIDLFDSGYDERGFSVFALSPEQAADSNDAAAQFSDQLTNDCGSASTLDDLETSIGPARHVVGEDCGPNAATAVMLAIDEQNSGFVFVVIAQGLEGPDGVAALATAVLESLYLN